MPQIIEFSFCHSPGQSWPGKCLWSYVKWSEVDHPCMWAVAHRARVQFLVCRSRISVIVRFIVSNFGSYKEWETSHATGGKSIPNLALTLNPGRWAVGGGQWGVTSVSTMSTPHSPPPTVHSSFSHRWHVFPTGNMGCLLFFTLAVYSMTSYWWNISRGGNQDSGFQPGKTLLYLNSLHLFQSTQLGGKQNEGYMYGIITSSLMGKSKHF